MMLHQPLPGFEDLTADVCRVCERPLTNPISIRAGIGPICARRHGISRAQPPTPKEEDTMPIKHALPRIGADIVLERTPEGDAVANLPKRHRHHDTTDAFEWGYHGSGPADLALNILARVLPPNDVGETVELWDKTRVSRDAWDLHQKFKAEVIAAVPFDGATIPRQLVTRWLERNT